MIQRWFDGDANESRTVTTLAEDAMRFSLHIISSAGFDKRLIWPGEGKDTHALDPEEIENGHTLNFTSALENLLHHMLLVLLVPKMLLSMMARPPLREQSLT